jgi:ABC-2 type transport system ATP-binding protein
VLTAEHLTRQFGTRTAVDDVSFEMSGGEIFALLGPNGAGKTTTLRMLAALIAPSSGAVRIDGEVVERHTAARLRGRVGFLTEAPGLWDRLTVRDNLMVYARLHRLRNPARAVEAVLGRFGVEGRAGDPPAQLSKGLRQRVALARTLLHQPDIILLDEPTSGLDPESARGVRDLIVSLRDEGKAVLLSTHNLDEVDRVATRVAVLRTRLIASDTPAALRARVFGTQVHIAIRVGAAQYAEVLRERGAAATMNGEGVTVDLSRGGPDVPDIVRCLVERGAAIESVVPQQPSLEDVYLRLLERDQAQTAARERRPA